MEKKIWFLVKLAILIGLFLFPYKSVEIWSLSIKLEGILNGLRFFLAGHLLIALGRFIVIGVYRRNHKFNAEHIDNFVVGVNQLVLISNVVIFVFASLISVNIRPWEAITSLTIVAAAIAIISKDYISNMINGMMIMFGNQLSIGDAVKIGDQKGKIIDLNLVNVHLLNEDDDLVYIPNNTIFTNNVINYSKRAIKKVSIDFEVGNNNLIETRLLEAHLIGQLGAFAEKIYPESYTLKITEIKKDAVNFKFQYVIKETDREVERQIRRTTVQAMVNFVREEK